MTQPFGEPVDPPPMLHLARVGRPHETFFFALSVLLGASYMLGAPKPGSITSLMPQWEVLIWAGALFLSGPVGLFGCWWKRDVPFALGMELTGLLLNSAAILMYGTAVLSLGAGWHASLPIGIIIAWTVANLFRARQIRKELRSIDAGG